MSTTIKLPDSGHNYHSGDSVRTSSGEYVTLTSEPFSTIAKSTTTFIAAAYHNGCDPLIATCELA